MENNKALWIFPNIYESISELSEKSQGRVLLALVKFGFGHEVDMDKYTKMERICIRSNVELIKLRQIGGSILNGKSNNPSGKSIKRDKKLTSFEQVSDKFQTGFRQVSDKFQTSFEQVSDRFQTGFEQVSYKLLNEKKSKLSNEHTFKQANEPICIPTPAPTPDLVLYKQEQEQEQEQERVIKTLDSGAAGKTPQPPPAQKTKMEIGCRFESSEFYAGDIPEKLPDAYAEHAKQRGFSDADALAEFQKFTSHWIGKTGKDAIKSRRGWLTAWATTWLVNAKRFRGNEPAKVKSPGPNWGPGGCPKSVIDEFLGKNKSESEVKHEHSV